MEEEEEEMAEEGGRGGGINSSRENGNTGAEEGRGEIGRKRKESKQEGKNV